MFVEQIRHRVCVPQPPQVVPHGLHGDHCDHWPTATSIGIGCLMIAAPRLYETLKRFESMTKPAPTVVVVVVGVVVVVVVGLQIAINEHITTPFNEVPPAIFASNSRCRSRRHIRGGRWRCLCRRRRCCIHLVWGI